MIISMSNDQKAIRSSIQQEKAFLKNYLKSQERINCSLHTILVKSFGPSKVSSIDESKKISDKLSSFSNMSNKSFFNIKAIKALIKNIETIDLSQPEYNKKIQIFNRAYVKLLDKVTKNTVLLEQFIFDYSHPEGLVSNNSSVTTNSSAALETIADDTNSTSENTLLISEVDDKVILPYSLETVNNLLEKNPDKYQNINDVIDDLYTRPLKYYKHASLARFKEAYKLVRKRQHGTVMQALDLAVELFSNYNLHPAIISACKNLDELDVYLSCLQYNELNDFHFFKTIFKISPMLSTKLSTQKK